MMIEKLLTTLGLKTPRKAVTASGEGFEHPEELLRRIALAMQTQRKAGLSFEILHDPIEDDRATARLVRKAAVKADKESDGKRGLGSCHRSWWRTKEILREKHGITWYSPDEMNPGVRFD